VQSLLSDIDLMQTPDADAFPCCCCLQVQVDVPDVQGRWDILKVHAKNKKLADDVNLEAVAMRVPGEARSVSCKTLQ